MVGYGVEETKQLCAPDLSFWSLLDSRLNSACKWAPTYEAEN